MTLCYSQLQALALQYGSPFYVVERERIEGNFEALTAAFGSRYQPFVLAYSYKTNYVPYVCRIVRDKGGWAEVVSRMEYELALKVGCEPGRIIFNGPVKRPEDIYAALEGGSMVNLDSEAEIEAVLEFAASHRARTVKVGLRVNIGLCDEAGQSHIQNRLKVGRFGFDPAGIEQAGRRLQAAGNIQIASLHGHTSTTDSSVWCFQTITETLVHMAERLFAESVEVINIGGGMFGIIEPEHRWCEVPSFDEYAEAVCGVLHGSAWVRRKKPALVIEPGVGMAANGVSFVTQVVSVKQIRGQRFVTADGSAFHCKPTFHGINPPFEIVSAGGAGGGVQRFDVVGSTCMEKDILLRGISGPLPSVGDFIRIHRVGAYTIVLSPPFIHPAPAIVAQESAGMVCVRRRQTLEDMFGCYRFD